MKRRVASRIIFPKESLNGLPDHSQKINDSKLLTAKQRSELFPWIQRHAFKIGIGFATHEEIDEINILKASLLSMERALHDSGIKPNLILVDGRFGLQSYPDSKPVVKGDRKCFYIACASIVAKVTRDNNRVKWWITTTSIPIANFRKNTVGYSTKDQQIFTYSSHQQKRSAQFIHRKLLKA